ncbi:MAG: inositol monophosphatase family protein [Patescibacteria group bacterium]|nr:inositol monophosphatase family protein [Patescibacteria group bacterium]
MKKTDDYSKYLEVCETAVRAAGKVVLDWVDRFEPRAKRAPNDLVTQADLASQETISRILLQAFPDHVIVGEEGQTGHDTTSGEGYRWIIDPVDGTTNFVHRVPHYAVSLALEHQGKVLVGAIFDPNADECFMAASGGGATLNGQPMAVSHAATLAESLAAVGFPYDVTRESPDMLVFLDAAVKCQAVRRTGSAALNLAYLAAGRFDLYWSFSTHVWDMAAGVLLVSEAGGVVTGPDGGPLQLDSGQFLAASTPQLHAELLNMVRLAVPAS